MRKKISCRGCTRAKLPSQFYHYASSGRRSNYCFDCAPKKKMGQTIRPRAVMCEHAEAVMKMADEVWTTYATQRGRDLEKALERLGEKLRAWHWKSPQPLG